MNTKDDFELNLAKLLLYLWRRLPVILLAAALTAGITFYSSRSPVQTRYIGKATFFIDVNLSLTEKHGEFDAENRFSSEDTAIVPLNSIPTYSYLTTSPAVLNEIIQRADLP